MSNVREQETVVRISQNALVVVAALTIAGCATSSSQAPQHTARAFLGTVTERQEVVAVPRSSGVYRPGMGGAVGGLVAGLVTNLGGTPAHWRYVVKTPDGSDRSVHATDQFGVGDCVAIYTAPSNTTSPPWNLGEATVKLESGCEHAAL